MSREIKFRAWDKERNEMRQVQLMDWSAWWVSTGSTWERGNALQYGERNSFKNEGTDRHIIMQYTGIKDKNGKEIYEGDIVKREWVEIRPGHNDFTGVVKYIEGSFCIEDIEDPYSGDSLFIEIGTNEVIGNIHEHPHLLEARSAIGTTE